MTERAFRFDLFIAVAALVISAFAAALSAYQVYIVRTQFSATVWPYLTFITNSTADKYFELDVSNAGIGPALILDAAITRDGKRIQRTVGPTALPAIAVAIEGDQLKAKVDALKSHEHGQSHMTASTLLPGDVIRAGQKLELLRVEGRFLTRYALADIKHIDVKICYCSLLADCWTKRLWDPEVEPVHVHDCPHSKASG